MGFHQGLVQGLALWQLLLEFLFSGEKKPTLFCKAEVYPLFLKILFIMCMFGFCTYVQVPMETRGTR